MTRIVTDECQVACPLGNQCLNQVIRHTGPTETANGDHGSVRNVRQRVSGARQQLVDHRYTSFLVLVARRKSGEQCKALPRVRVSLPVPSKGHNFRLRKGGLMID
ncbi:hypothetical protein D3C86_1607880 [compost metagenome]